MSGEQRNSRNSIFDQSVVISFRLPLKKRFPLFARERENNSHTVTRRYNQKANKTT